MVLGKYNLNIEEQAELYELITNVLDALRLDQRHKVSLSEYGFAPCHIREEMRRRGWKDNDFETNGWEGDTWYYFSHPDYKYTVVMFYCGYTFSIEMYRGDIDDE